MNFLWVSVKENAMLVDNDVQLIPPLSVSGTKPNLHCCRLIVFCSYCGQYRSSDLVSILVVRKLFKSGLDVESLTISSRFYQNVLSFSVESICKAIECVNVRISENGCCIIRKIQQLRIVVALLLHKFPSYSSPIPGR